MEFYSFQKDHAIPSMHLVIDRSKDLYDITVSKLVYRSKKILCIESVQSCFDSHFVIINITCQIRKYSGSKNYSYRCTSYFSLPDKAPWIISLVILIAQPILYLTVSPFNFMCVIGQKTISKQKKYVFQVPETPI